MDSPLPTGSTSKVIFPRYSAYYSQLKEIGKGRYGRVFLCKHVLDLGEYVIKLVPFDQKHKNMVLREVRALKMSQHPNVVRYYHCWIEAGIFENPSGYTSNDPEHLIEDPDSASTLFIAMEHCPRTLKDRLSGPILKEEIFELFKQLMQGLSYLHDVGVVHLDLKPENIFLDIDGKLKLGDFGLAVVKQENGDDYQLENDSREELNVIYHAPELKELKEQKSITFSEKVDTYSAGLILLEMTCSPLSTLSEKCRLFDEATGGKLPGEITADKTMKVMLQALLNKNPKVRIGAKDMLLDYPQ